MNDDKEARWARFYTRKSRPSGQKTIIKEQRLIIGNGISKNVYSEVNIWTWSRLFSTSDLAYKRNERKDVNAWLPNKYRPVRYWSLHVKNYFLAYFFFTRHSIMLIDGINSNDNINEY